MTELKASTKSKISEKGQEKPFANNLGDHPELRDVFERVSGKPHPLDKNNIFKKMIFSHIGNYITLARKMVPTQECHYLLPKNERVEKNRQEIGVRLYPEDPNQAQVVPSAEDKAKDFKILTDKEEDIGFKMHPKMSSNLFIAFMGVIKKEFALCFFLFFLGSASEFAKLVILKRALEDVSDQINHYGKIQYKNQVFLDFFWVLAINISANIFENMGSMFMYRFSVRLEGGLHGLMYEKFMRIGVVNPYEHDEGSIINYIQTDVESFNNTVLGLGFFFSSVVTLAASLYLGLNFFGGLFWILVVGLIAVSLLTAPFIALSMINYQNAKKETDKRLSVMKNLLKNIKFVKVSGLENFLFAKLSRVRQSEVNFTVNSNRFQLIMIGASRFFIQMLLVVFFYYYMHSGADVSVANVTTLMMIFNMFSFSMMGTVGGLGFLAGSYVHVKRLSCFFNAREMVDFYRVRREDSGSEFAIKITDGSFFWDKKMSKEEAEEKRKIAMGGGKKKKDKKKKGDKKRVVKVSEESIDLISQVEDMEVTTQGGSELEDRLVKDGEDATDEEDEQKVGFEMNGINFRARKGDLTVLIGKIGSGKSSLLYSILGEMRVKDVEKTKVVVNGTVGFLSQNPWLINGTVKENILLDKTYNEERFAWALKYSALDHDIKLWDDKEDHIIGENGAALSGGQKARIALARCLYQE